MPSSLPSLLGLTSSARLTPVRPGEVVPAGVTVAVGTLAAAAGIAEQTAIDRSRGLGTPWLLPSFSSPLGDVMAYGATLDADSMRGEIVAALLGGDDREWMVFRVPAGMISTGRRYAATRDGAAAATEGLAGAAGEAQGAIGDAWETVRGAGSAAAVAMSVLPYAAAAVAAVLIGVLVWRRK